MNGHSFTQLTLADALVRKYQLRWQICLDRKTHSYYWPEMFAP
jgi:hypothetical protein